jgi:predicted AAA+ superfamily ATPase
LHFKTQGFILQGIQRACEPLFAEYLAAFPCIAILGPRQCGKTTLAGALPADWRRFDLERGSDRDLVARGLGVSPPTARDYFEIAHGTFLWRRLPPYVKQATKRLVKHSKGHLRDSGLLHRLLHLADLDALLGHPQAGRSWEAMVSEEILRQLEWRGLDCGAFFYRTSAGAEIDLVLEGDVGLVPIEIKSTHTIDRRRLAALRDFVADRRCRYGLVITNDSEPRLLDEAIVAIPFSHL